MQIKSHRLQLDAIISLNQLPFDVFETDYNSNELVITVTRNMNYYPLKGLTANIAFEKSDGIIVLENDITITDNRVICILKTNVINKLGEVKAQLMLYNADVLINTLPFTFNVTDTIIGNGFIESFNEAPVLIDLIGKVERLEEDISTAEESRVIVEQQRVDTFNEIMDRVDNSKTALDQSIDNSATAKQSLDGSITNSVTAKNNLDESITTSNTKKTQLDASIAESNTKKTALDGSINTANSAKSDLDSRISSGNTLRSQLDASTSNANTSKNNLDGSITISNTKKTQLDASITESNTRKTALDGSITTATNKNTELNNTINTANIAKSALDESIAEGGNLFDEVSRAKHSSVKNKQFEYMDSRLEEIEEDIESSKEDYTNHLVDNMPHLIEDLKNDIKYKYGLQLSATGQPQIIFEEVI